MKIRPTLFAISPLLFLVVCLSSVPAQTRRGRQEPGFPSVRTVLSERRRDRDLEAAILKTLDGYEEEFRRAGERDPDVLEHFRIRYFYNHVDLNDDGRPEALVWLRGGNVGGTSGYVTQIFGRHGHEYRVLYEIEPTWNPIIVSQKRTNGWHDLVTKVVGGGIQPGYWAELRFDGTGYPDGFSGTAVTAKSVRGVAYVADDRRTGFAGIPLEPIR